jgi:hypothetical protein
MRVRLTAVVVAAVAVCLGGVAVAAVPLQRFLARPGEETGFTPKGRPLVHPTLHNWLDYSGGGEKRQRRLDAARLRREGFVRAVVQSMAYDRGTPSNSGGSSTVVELGSSHSAKAEQRVEFQRDISAEGLPKTYHYTKIHRFAVSGVPGALGYTAVLSGRHPFRGAYVVFTEGRCELLLAGAFGDTIPDGNLAGRVKAGVRAIHRRTNGHCP